MIAANRSYCLPLKSGRLNYLDVFATVKAVKAQKNRASNPYSATIWANNDFTGEARDLGIGTHDISNLNFQYIRAVWVPNGYWVMFCKTLSDDRKLCGPGRGRHGLTFLEDSNRIQPTGGDVPQYEYNYFLVGKGQPPLEPKSIIFKDPNLPDTKTVTRPDWLPKPDTKPLKPKPKKKPLP